MEINYLKLQKELEIRQNIMYIYLANEIHSTTGSQYGQILHIPFDAVENSNGNFLSFDSVNNGIEIGKDINKVRVTTKVLFDASSYNIESPTVGILIQKNTYQLTYQTLQRVKNTTYQQVEMETVLDVTQGDLIYVDFRSVAIEQQNITINAGRGDTYLIVEAIC